MRWHYCSPIEELTALKLQMVSHCSCWACPWLTKYSVGFDDSEFSPGIGTAFNSSWVNSNSESRSMRSRSDMCFTNSSIFPCIRLPFSRSIPKPPCRGLVWGTFFRTIARCCAAKGIKHLSSEWALQKVIYQQNTKMGGRITASSLSICHQANRQLRLERAEWLGITKFIK